MFQEQSYSYPQTNFMAKVYAWMCVALAITAVTAWYVASTPVFYVRITQQPLWLLLIFLVQITLIVGLRARLDKMNYPTAIILFIAYAISVGFTMSLLLQMYTLVSIGSTFLVTSAMFGGMAIYGYITRSDLAQMHSILIMVVWGLIVAMLVNIFLKSMWFDYVVSMIGVIVFALLTATDTQKIRQLGQNMLADRQTQSKISLIGALTLYLDFLNLFLFLLRFTGNRRQQ